MKAIRYRANGGKWEPLTFLGKCFFSMEEAIRFIRNNSEFGTNRTELRQYNDNGESVTEWDNF